MGYSEELYQKPQILKAHNSITAYDLTAGAAYSGKVYIPTSIGKIDILGFGMNMAAAGGAQTTAGTFKLQKNGADVTQGGIANGTVPTCASVASHAEGSCVEATLNSASSTNPTVNPGDFNSPPTYPTASPGDILTFVNGTTGVGSDQTCFPYVIYRRSVA